MLAVAEVVQYRAEMVRLVGFDWKLPPYLVQLFRQLHNRWEASAGKEQWDEDNYMSLITDLTHAGPLGVVLALTIMGLITLYKDNRDLEKSNALLEEKRVDDEKNVVSQVVLKMESIDNEIRAILISLDKSHPLS
jgi:hypothetical protein